MPRHPGAESEAAAVADSEEAEALQIRQRVRARNLPVQRAHLLRVLEHAGSLAGALRHQAAHDVDAHTAASNTYIPTL